ncbi:MAG TPA: ribonuclease H-like domain-containing protein [Candidatus Dormibacteraeota bacterium]|nr:ribonuclease H-like domain-containing protein [Candidatus Dormibacteraeota bacterium]HEV2476152.1 ribonuclease H-like domain-containing protein [Candidatus Dormibacteraeota bacterium]
MRVRAAEPATTQIPRMDAEAPPTRPTPASPLRERLTRLGAAPRPRPRPRSYELPRGFEEIETPFGAAAIRQDVIPLPALDPDPGRIAYIDTETTGLAGGTGTYAFTAAIATPIDCGLRLAQLFLPEPGMESAFLYALGQEVEPASGIATFNGGSFDLPVLRTRWVMARMPGELTHGPHTDLLTLVRALYRHRLENCTLRFVEQRVLGYERDDPLPSALVPDAYFAYLRAGSRDFLEAALEHNRLDVISLVHLHSRLLRRLRGADVDMNAEDWLALGRHRWRRGAKADGWRALRNATAFAAGEAAATAGLLISRRLLRRGSVSSADRLLDWLESSAREDLRVSVARARLLEWRRRDPQKALRVVEDAARRMPESAQELATRRARLERKVRRRDRSPKRVITDSLPF